MASTAPSYIPRFCPSLRAEIVFVRKKSGAYSKYIFDTEANQFKPVNCSDCVLNATEKQLFPLYSVWSNRLSRYVIFADNKITRKIEQFVYSQNAKRFEQVDERNLTFNPSRIQVSNTLFTVSGNSNEGVTVILRGPKGYFRKEQFDLETNQYEVLPPVPVHFLPAPEPSVPITIHLPVGRVNEMMRETIEALPVPNWQNEIPLEYSEDSDACIEVIHWLLMNDFDCDKSHEYEEIHTPLETSMEIPKISDRDASDIRKIARAMGNCSSSSESSEFNFV